MSFSSCIWTCSVHWIWWSYCPWTDKPTIYLQSKDIKIQYNKATASFCQCWKSSWFFRRFSYEILHVNGFSFPFFSTVYIRVLFLPFGESCTAGHECMLGSAMYLKSTGISLKNNIAIFCITKVRSSFNKQFYLNSSFNSSMCVFWS